ncbi:MAG TPA: hypothetical protein VJA87_01970 [Candidatus Paceibacterota bacterium]
MKEGFGVPERKLPTAEGVLASQVLDVLNKLQEKRAVQQFSNNHPDRKVDISSMGNEIIGEWIVSGSAEAFAEEFGNPDSHQIQQALREIDAPNVGETQH